MAVPYIRLRTGELQSERFNETGRTYEIIIRDSDLISDLTDEFCTDDRGFIINYPSEDDFFQDAIKGSRCTFGMVVNDAKTAAFVGLVVDGQEDRFYVEILRNGNPFWRGVIAQDENRQENKEQPYIFEITAIDGLTELENKSGLIEPPGTFPSGINNADNTRAHTLLQAFIYMLNSTKTSNLFDDTDVILTTGFRWFASEIIAGNDPFANMLYYADNIEYSYDAEGKRNFKSYFDIMKFFLEKLELRIMMIEGVYQIQQVNQLYYTTLTISSYAKNYEITSNNPNDVPIGNPTKNVSQTIQKTIDCSLPISGNTNYGKQAGDLFLYQGALKRVFITYDFNTDVFYRVRQQDYTGSFVTTGAYIQANTSSRLGINFNTYVTTQSTNYNIFTCTIQMRVGIYYYEYSTNSWVTNTAAIAFDRSLTIYDNPALLYQGRNIPTPPVSGFLEVLVTATATKYPSGPAQTIISVLTDLGIGYLDDQGNPVQARFEVENNNTQAASSSLDLDLGTTLIGDRANDPVTLQQWAVWNLVGGGWIPSTTWQIEKAGTAYEINALLCVEHSRPRRKPLKKWEVNIIGDYTPNQTILSNNMVFIFNGGTFTMSTETFDAVMLELDLSISGGTLTKDDGFGDGFRRNTDGGLYQGQTVGQYGEAAFQTAPLATTDAAITSGVLTGTIPVTEEISGTIVAGDELTLTNDLGVTETVTAAGSVSGGNLQITEYTFTSDYPEGTQLNINNAQLKGEIESIKEGYIPLTGSDQITGSLVVNGDNLGFGLRRTDGTLAGAIVSDNQDEFGMIVGGFDDSGNPTQVGLFGSNIYMGPQNQYIANNGAQPYGYLKLGGTPITGPNGNDFYPITFQQIEQELYSESFNDVNQYNISSGADTVILNTTPLANSYAEPGDYEFTFRLEETSPNQSTEVEVWFRLNGVTDSPRYTYTVGANTIVTITGGQAFGSTTVLTSGDTIQMYVKALDTGSGRTTFVRGDDSATTLKIRQLGFGTQALNLNIVGTGTNIINLYSEEVVELETEGNIYTLPLLSTISNKTATYNFVNVSGGEVTVKTTGSDTIYFGGVTGKVSEICLEDGDNMRVYLRTNDYKVI